MIHLSHIYASLSASTLLAMHTPTGIALWRRRQLTTGDSEADAK
jgi:hypothetical protein